MWKKTAESEELIVFERQIKNLTIKIEARKNTHGWEVFKTKIIGDSSDLISEYVLDSKQKAMQMIEKLKNDGNLTVKPSTNVSIRRVYKEELFEKWAFEVNKEKYRNFVLVKFDTLIRADIVMHEKYMTAERDVINQISEKLGLDELGEGTDFDIYYFKKFTNTKKVQKSEISQIDVEFDFSEDEYY